MSPRGRVGIIRTTPEGACEGKKKLTDFKTLGLSTRILAKLEEMGLTVPTPIQDKAIPHLLNGRDVMGLAQTGTGKTLAFGLPLIQQLSQLHGKPAPKTVRSLILAPTRELAKQIEVALSDFTRGTPIKVGVVTGGASINVQVDRLSRGLDILVATPGRLMDLLERRALTLTEARWLVLDEADQMLDLGFIHSLRKIAKLLAPERQTMLFSATMPKLMSEIAASYLNSPIRIEVGPPGQPVDQVTQAVHFVTQGDKAKLLESYLDKHREDLALVFSRTKHGAEKLMKLLSSWGFAAGSIHGNKSQGQRDRALNEFKSRQIRVLVATDVAARGLDIPAVRHVYNYDLPNVAENYVHRIGRTARAGADGAAIAFCAPDEMGELRDIEKAMKNSIPVIGGTEWTPVPGQKRRGNSGGGGKPGGFKPAGGAKPAGGMAHQRRRNQTRSGDRRRDAA